MSEDIKKDKKQQKRAERELDKRFFKEHRMFRRPLMGKIFDAVEEARSEPNGRTPFNDEIKVVEDVVYKTADGQELQLDVYLPTRSVGAAVLDIPGGGWMIHNRKRRAGYARCFAAMGATVFVIDHRLCPETIFPQNLEDCIDAYNFIVEHAEQYGVDPHNITVTGDSSGGHLSACLAVAACNEEYSEKLHIPRPAIHPAGMIFVSGAFSMKVMLRIPFTHTLEVRYVTRTHSRSEFRKSELSTLIEPYNFLNAEFPPSFNDGGGFDMLCAGEAKRMAGKLSALGVSNEYAIGRNIFNGGHCYVLRFPFAPARRDALKLYRWYLKREEELGVDMSEGFLRVEKFLTDYKAVMKKGEKC